MHDRSQVVLHKVTDFFLGMNAGQWLKIRLQQIADGSQQLLLPPEHSRGSSNKDDIFSTDQLQAHEEDDHTRSSCCFKCSYEQLLAGTGFELLDTVEAPELAQQHKFELGTSFVTSTAADDWHKSRL